MMLRRLLRSALPALMLLAAGCGGSEERHGPRGSGPPGGVRGGGGERPWGADGGGRGGTAVPVEVARVVRRDVSSYIETNGTLEAENEVDVVARVTGPLIELLVEEGDAVEKGRLLARIDDLDYRAELEIARVTLNETRLAFERAKNLQQEKLISAESFDQAQSAFETAEARFEAARILLGYTEVRAPFGGWIINRYVQLAEQVSSSMPLFRISDFNPLLCPIQVPERELPRLRAGQAAYLTVEPFPGERFEASVLRLSPVVDAATGTVKVTLEVDTRDKLRPGMFARVFVEIATRPGALVIPKSALSLESIGDTVYVADGEVAGRREVELGFREGDFVEVTTGLSEGESVVVVGQDGLSEGTPIQPLEPERAGAAPPAETAQADSRAGDAPREMSERGGGSGGRRPDLANLAPEELERVKQRMRDRGMSEEQIEERLRRARERATADSEN